MSKQEWLIGIMGILLGMVLTITFTGAYYTSHHRDSGFGDMIDMMQGDQTTQGSCDENSCEVN